MAENTSLGNDRAWLERHRGTDPVTPLTTEKTFLQSPVISGGIRGIASQRHRHGIPEASQKKPHQPRGHQLRCPSQPSKQYTSIHLQSWWVSAAAEKIWGRAFNFKWVLNAGASDPAKASQDRGSPIWNIAKEGLCTISPLSEPLGSQKWHLQRKGNQVWRRQKIGLQ